MAAGSRAFSVTINTTRRDRRSGSGCDRDRRLDTTGLEAVARPARSARSTAYSRRPDSNLVQSAICGIEDVRDDHDRAALEPPKERHHVPRNEPDAVGLDAIFGPLLALKRQRAGHARYQSVR